MTRTSVAPVQPRDAGRVAAQQLRREVAERADHARLDQLELAEQVVLAVRRSPAAAGRGCRAAGTCRTLATKTSPRVEPDLAEQLSSSGRPGRRTAGPARPRCAPGASPTNIRSASALPEPKTTVWRVCGELRAAGAARRLVEDGLELLAALLGGAHRPAVYRPGGSAGCADAATPGYASEHGVATGRHPGADRSTQSITHPPLPSRYLMRELDRIAIVGAAASAPRCAARCAPPAWPSTARSAAATAPRRRRRRAALRPGRRDRRRRRRRRRPGRLVGHCSGATTLDVARAGHEAFSLHPLMTVPARRAADFAGAGAAVAGADAARARGRARRSPTAARHAPDRGRRRGPRRLPRRRLDRLELPRHARGRRRALARHRRRRPRRCSPRSCAPPSRTGPRSAPRARSPARSPAATRRRSPASARRVAERAPELLPLYDALADATRRAGRRDEDRAHRRRGPRARRAPRAARAARVGLVPDDGRLPRRPPGADARGRASSATRSSSRCSSTRRSSTRPPTSPPTRATRRATPRSPPSAGVDVLFAPTVDEVYPAGFATTVTVAGLADALEGAHAARATSPASPRS